MVVTERHLRRWTAGLLVVTGLIVVLSTLTFHTVKGTDRHELYTYVHVGSELGLAAYWNAGLLALVSAAAVLSGLLTARRRIRWGWFVVGAVALFLSIDEATMLHEKTARLVSSNPFPTYAWVVVGIPLAVLLVLVLWVATRPLPATLKRGLAVALGLYILGALGFEALSGFWSRQERPGVSNVFATVEESLEILACVLAIHVIARQWLPLTVAMTQRREPRPPVDVHRPRPSAARMRS
jgi:hypothetical protein